MDSPAARDVVLPNEVGREGRRAVGYKGVVVVVGPDGVVGDGDVIGVVERQPRVRLAALRRVLGHLPVGVQQVVLGDDAVGLVDDESVDAIEVALVVGEQVPAVEVLVVVPSDVHTGAVDDEGLVARAVAGSRDVHIVVYEVLRVVVVGVVVRYAVDIAKDFVALYHHLDDVVRVGVQPLGQHNRTLGVARPPGVIIDAVVLDGHVVAVLGADGRVGAMVHDIVGDADVVAAPHDDAAPGVAIGLNEPILRRLFVRDHLVGTFNLEACDLEVVDTDARDAGGAIKGNLRAVSLQVGQLHVCEVADADSTSVVLESRASAVVVVGVRAVANVDDRVCARDRNCSRDGSKRLGVGQAVVGIVADALVDVERVGIRALEPGRRRRRGLPAWLR